MKTHILGFPSIGRQRELKHALEAFWKGNISEESLFETSASLKKNHWQVQKDAGLDYVTTGDFSFYDRMLDLTCALGVIHPRFHPCANDTGLQQYFNFARGDVKRNISALEMTKWFDTNYHYLVPEIGEKEAWIGSEHPVIKDTILAKESGFSPKPSLIGPFTWLALAKAENENIKWSQLSTLITKYTELLLALSPLSSCIQIEEPVLCSELLPEAITKKFTSAYAELNAASGNKLLLTSYFGPLGKNLQLAVQAGCAALHIDLVRGERQLPSVLQALPKNTALSLGLVNGRNVWKTNYSKVLPLIRDTISAIGQERVLLASSCSLSHSPVDLSGETALAEHIKNRMAFAVQKCTEITDLRDIIKSEYTSQDEATKAASQAKLHANLQVFEQAELHSENNIPAVRKRVAAISESDICRLSPYPVRRKAQSWLNLPLLPTTTIGSFPQTSSIRKSRLDYKRGNITEEAYIAAIKEEIKSCIEKQETLDLDVLVHGEAERNDMVEYFGQQLGGFCFTQNGWVQSYGSRYVKPPVIYGDVYRKHPMTVDWITYAQSLTKKPVKGMLTGPVTILCWSFVRDDLERSEVCKQIALAIRDEVQDLEKAGVHIIQIDEAALREGMPLTKIEADRYIQWAVDAFRLTASGVKDSTQIHTHMCYSEFNAILPWIAKMDADVISIESSRSRMELLEAFTVFHYEAEVGPGVYDIHSPRIPTKEEMVELLQRALEYISKEQLWVNPDCGLKTRQWEEAYPSLENMIAATKVVRKSLG